MFSFRIKNLALALLAIFLIAAAPACKAKYGCPAGDASAMESKKKKKHRARAYAQGKHARLKISWRNNFANYLAFFPLRFGRVF